MHSKDLSIPDDPVRMEQRGLVRSDSRRRKPLLSSGCHRHDRGRMVYLLQNRQRHLPNDPVSVRVQWFAETYHHMPTMAALETANSLEKLWKLLNNGKIYTDAVLRHLGNLRKHLVTPGTQ